MHAEENEPFPQENEQAVQDLLTPEEVDIAFAYLRRSYPGLSLEQIVSTLDHYIHQTPTSINQRYYRQTNQPELVPPPPQRSRRRLPVMARDDIREEVREERELNAEQRLRRSAAFFCKEGFNPRQFQENHPEMNQSDFRSSIASIMKTIMEKLIKAMRLKYKAKINLSPHEKGLIGGQMTHAHQWMAVTNLSAFTTLLKLIEQEYLRIRSVTEDDELRNLYNTIVRRVSSNNIDLMEVGERKASFGPEIEERFPAMHPEQVVTVPKKKTVEINENEGEEVRKVQPKRPREEPSSQDSSSFDPRRPPSDSSSAPMGQPPLNYSSDSLQYLIE